MDKSKVVFKGYLEKLFKSLGAEKVYILNGTTEDILQEGSGAVIDIEGGSASSMEDYEIIMTYYSNSREYAYGSLEHNQLDACVEHKLFNTEPVLIWESGEWVCHLEV